MAKTIRWSAPKHVHIREDKAIHSRPSRTWKEKYACRKLKAEHSFAILEIKWLNWLKEFMVVARCKGCNKKKVSFR